MKKIKTALLATTLAAGLVLSLAAGALAAPAGYGQRAAARACVTRTYVDADGDGICDNRTGDKQTGANYVDANGDGVCDNRVNGKQTGANYVDADGDGVCDNRGSGVQARDGSGNQSGRGWRGGRR